VRGGRLVTARALAERLEVSERTIYRDVADLIGCGVPIDGEAGIGYMMRAGFELPPLMFTRDELSALALGASFVKAWGGLRMALAAEEALVKIAAVLPEGERAGRPETNLFAISFGQPESLKSVLDRLDSAITGRRRTQITYEALDGERTDRVLRPLGLAHWGKVWTLTAWCEMRVDFRNFRADCIRDLVDCGDTFRLEPGKTLKDFLRRMAECGEGQAGPSGPPH
jgi:predicted DNA-binding transcriptional regulator YafY